MNYYVIEQINATGNGRLTTIVLVTNLKIEAGAIHATKVGEVDWERSDKKYVFNHAEPTDFFIIGNATCEEIKNPFGE